MSDDAQSSIRTRNLNFWRVNFQALTNGADDDGHDFITSLTAQIRRASDECIFMLMGELIEHTRTEDLFLNPRNPKTSDYIEGGYG